DVSHERVLQGDTDAAPTGPGTGGSRSAVIAGGAARQAAREVRTRMIAIAANELEAAPEDLEIVDGHIHVAGTPTRGVSVADVSRKAYYEPGALPPGQAPGLEGQARYTPAATEVPEIEHGHIETPAPTNPGGHKGMGEGGAIASPPAVINAVADALAAEGVQARVQPLGPADVLRLLEGKLTPASSIVSTG